jgi:predicted phosphodiesterase
MKVAVISDIHGFSLALDSVLADIDREPGIDSIIAAGDLCEGGPDPCGVIDRLKERQIACIRGNTDRDLVAGVRSSNPALWVTRKLGKAGLGFLGELPSDLRVTPPGGQPGPDDLLVVHANPYDEDRHMPPWLSEREIREMLGDTQAAVIAFGHIHIAYRRQVDAIQLIDVSAVGNPKDEDLRSKWGLCTWDESTKSWKTELRYVEYPLEATVEQIHQSGYPKPEKAVSRLQRASYRVTA